MHAHVREVGILISNHTMREGDRGVVVIGSSVDLGQLKALGYEYLPCSLDPLPILSSHILNAITLNLFMEGKPGS